jgi:ribose transport system substrate-binding protein
MPEEAQFRIGFSNLIEESSFCVAVRESIQAAVAKYPDLALICRDNALDDDRALANAQYFADVSVNLAIIYHINQAVGDMMRQILTLGKKIPIISLDIPILWTTYFGVDNKYAGELAGKALGTWIQNHWGGHVDKVVALTETRVAESVRMRTENALTTLRTLVRVNPDHVLHIDSGNLYDVSVQRTASVLERWSGLHRIAMIGFNEDTTLALLEAARKSGRLEDVAVVGQGANRTALQELRRPDTRLIATTGYRPDAYGPHLIDLARRILSGERVPPYNYVELDLFTPENVPAEGATTG